MNGARVKLIIWRKWLIMVRICDHTKIDFFVNSWGWIGDCYTAPGDVRIKYTPSPLSWWFNSLFRETPKLCSNKLQTKNKQMKFLSLTCGLVLVKGTAFNLEEKRLTVLWMSTVWLVGGELIYYCKRPTINAGYQCKVQIYEFLIYIWLI